MPDHVHMMVSIPPKYSVSQVVGYLKGKSAIHIVRRYMERRQMAGELPYASTLLRHLPARARRGYPHGPVAAPPQQRAHDSDLYPHAEARRPGGEKSARRSAREGGGFGRRITPSSGGWKKLSAFPRTYVSPRRMYCIRSKIWPSFGGANECRLESFLNGFGGIYGKVPGRLLFSCCWSYGRWSKIGCLDGPIGK